MQFLSPSDAGLNIIVESSSASELAALFQEAVEAAQLAAGAAVVLSFANITLSAGGDGRKFVCSAIVAPAAALVVLATTTLLTVANMVTGTASGHTGSNVHVRFTQAGNAVDLLAARAAAIIELESEGVTRLICLETAVASNDGQMAEMIVGIDV